MKTPTWLILTLAFVTTTAPAIAGLAPSDEDLADPQTSTPLGDVCTSGTLDAAVDQCEKWAARYNGPASGSDQRAKEIVVSPDGERVFVVGENWDDIGGPWARAVREIAVVAYDAETGQELWAHRQNGAPGWHSYTAVGDSLAVSPDSSTVYFASSPFNGAASYRDMTMTALDADTGEVSWRTSYIPSRTPNYEYAVASTLSPDGEKIALTGFASAAHGDAVGPATVMFDAENGEELWVSRHGNASSVTAIEFNPDGERVHVTGVVFTEETDADIHTLTFDATTGQTLWTSTYDGGDGADTVAGCRNTCGGMEVSPDGSLVYVAGTSFDETDEEDTVVLAYDANTGDEAWTTRHDDRGESDYGGDIQANPDGSGIFVTSLTEWAKTPDGRDRAYSVLAFDTQGEKQWGTTYTNDDTLVGLAVGPAGKQVFVAGMTQPGPYEGYRNFLSWSNQFVVSHNATDGEATWGASYTPTPGSLDQHEPNYKTENEARDLALSPDGSTVFLAGNTASTNAPYTNDYLTVAFDTDAQYDQRIP